MINFGIVINVIGVLLILLGAFLLLPIPFSIFYESGDINAFLKASIASIITGTIFWFSTKSNSKKLGKKEGYLIVALGWITVSFISALPYYFQNLCPNPTNAIFESVSGLTTTGATIFNDIEALPHGILVWRSLTQWIGGMGIIVLTVALFPLLGIAGVELFVNEAPGPTSMKIHPRIKETAKRLWFIYFGLTALLVFLLSLTDMNFFDAINHGLTTMATGGFSTKNDSIAHFNSPLIHYLILAFMFVGGINYTVIYFFFKMKFKSVLRSEEFKTYCVFVMGLILALSIYVYTHTNTDFEESFRTCAFQIVSMITTTGFVLQDYTVWSPAITMVFFSLLFLGACAGSTSGGIKIVRHLLLFKNTYLDFKRLLHPRAIITTKLDGKTVSHGILAHVLVFLLLYLMLFLLGSICLSFILVDFDQPMITAVGGAATCLGNVGPAIGQLGPVDNFSFVPNLGKWICILLMLLGRLELFTILILLYPRFWKSN